MEKLECLSRGKLENQLILANSLLEWIKMILEDEEVSDFALSFPIIREIYKLKKGDEER